jgi:hypothetical protein
MNDFNCLITDVIRTTLSSCDYNNCTQLCMDYLLYIGYNCPFVFNNDVYVELWSSLFDICANTDELKIHTISHYT